MQRSDGCKQSCTQSLKSRNTPKQRKTGCKTHDRSGTDPRQVLVSTRPAGARVVRTVRGAQSIVDRDDGPTSSWKSNLCVCHCQDCQPRLQTGKNIPGARSSWGWVSVRPARTRTTNCQLEKNLETTPPSFNSLTRACSLPECTKRSMDAEPADDRFEDAKYAQRCAAQCHIQKKEAAILALYWHCFERIRDASITHGSFCAERHERKFRLCETRRLKLKSGSSGAAKWLSSCSCDNLAIGCMLVLAASRLVSRLVQFILVHSEASARK